MVSYMDNTSQAPQYTFDINKSPLFKKDNNNYINVLGVKQLNTLENVSLLDIFLSANNVIEPHYHPNAAELVYCISGAATVSILNPFTKQLLHYSMTPGHVVNIPRGWWHYEVAKVNNTHLLAIFDAPTPEVILGSDILKFTPAKIMAHTYCLDENQWKQAIAPIKPSTYIGPYKNCNKAKENISHPYLNWHQQYPPQCQHQPYVPPYQQYWG
ncbi:cupin domain-containing protein [Parageobacillus thermoglucosidasius]|uniref:Cupin domain protein n=1 Tax=Geobacillus sp. (strain Y4.1MC1) TaxID=581103 RepID=A0A7U4DM74_GEOS0|nr:cupin domain-containing protein [Parageobacillus thermoglucosidasius]AEH49192.1 Cupin domain protein [Parageobacillus thermoglucosidasius C56-YS93]MED4902933.1 cupin domain-containing protein [Parageobacillus thermoglucosidasius]MED4915274.1 cupin domain-containing protein [Parageobacillus thermoglucosidasius]MED4946197.1 cupin domain-containing protein [Parageobacillus thermoglucosidasius]MED4981795.1 cupin domain-containing protein [Parageobacillus thermoglucosidasius]